MANDKTAKQLGVPLSAIQEEVMLRQQYLNDSATKELMDRVMKTGRKPRISVLNLNATSERKGDKE